MKRLLTVAAIATSLLAISSCTKRPAGTLANANPPNGEWMITYYNDGGENITSNYADYIFSFKGSNAVTATINGKESSGYWAISAEDQRQECNIGFDSGDDKLSNINDDWEVVNFSENELVLTEDGNELHFRRQEQPTTPPQETDTLIIQN